MQCRDVETARAIPLLRLLSRALLGRTRRARDRADDGPVVFVHHDRLLLFRPEVDGDVVVAVAENAGLDGQVAHALAEASLAANGRPLDDDSRRFPDSLKHADLRAERIHEGHT